MSQEYSISFGSFDTFTWIRVKGKGSFLQSPELKECAEVCRGRGEKVFVIDLEDCTGMDSTFMGNLAALSRKLMRDGGELQIALPGDRNRRSLVDLGLDCLLTIEPEEADWVGKEEEIRAKLEPFQAKKLPDARERARHVLESHQTLAAANDSNAKKFETVLQVMEQEAAGGKGA